MARADNQHNRDRRARLRSRWWRSKNKIAYRHLVKSECQSPVVRRGGVLLGQASSRRYLSSRGLAGGSKAARTPIVTEYSSTTLIPSGVQARVDSYGNLIINFEKPPA
jgi:hypothetical protein